MTEEKMTLQELLSRKEQQLRLELVEEVKRIKNANYKSDNIDWETGFNDALDDVLELLKKE